MPLSARAIYQEIRSNHETYRLFCSIAARGESRGGWENGRIAALTGDPELAAKIARHGADEDKQGKLFLSLLRKRGHGQRVRSMLREYALVEIRTYRDVSLAVMGQMGEALGWSGAKRVLLGTGIRAIYLIERLFRWRRMTTLRRPEIINPLGVPATSRS